MSEKHLLKKILTKDLVKCYFELLPSCDYVVKRAFHAVMQSPAPRFYVDYHNARRYISQIEKRGDCNITRPLRRKMYFDLHRIWKERCGKGKQGRFLVLEQIIEEPAPSFYLDKVTIMHYVYDSFSKKKRYEK